MTVRWQQLNLPHDWVVALPFDSAAMRGHGYKAGISGGDQLKHHRLVSPHVHPAGQ